MADTKLSDLFISSPVTPLTTDLAYLVRTSLGAAGSVAATLGDIATLSGSTLYPDITNVASTTITLGAVTNDDLKVSINGPYSALTVGGVAYANMLLVHDNSNDVESLLTLHRIAPNTTALAGALSIFAREGDGAGGVIANGNWLGGMVFVGHDGTDFETAAAIIGVVDGAPGNNDMPGRLEFYATADGSAALVERMRITSTIIVASVPLQIYRDLTGADTGNQASGDFKITVEAGDSLTNAFPLSGRLTQTGGTVSSENAAVSGIALQSGGTCDALEGMGAVVGFSGGTASVARAFNCQVAVSADGLAAAFGSKYSITHTAGAITGQILCSSHNIAQSVGATSPDTVGLSQEILISGSNTVLHGIKSLVNVSNGTNPSVIGAEFTVTLSGGTVGAAYGLIVNGPDAISTDPNVALFKSRKSNSYGVLIQGAGSQSSPLLYISSSVGAELFKVLADGGVVGASSITTAGAILPSTNDVAALGSSSLGWSDLFLASGGVINFANGGFAITHSANTLTFQDPTASTGTTLVIVKAGAGQSTDLFVIQNSSGTPIVRFNSTGKLFGNDVALTGEVYAGSWIGITSRFNLNSGADGTINLTNAAADGFTRLNFGPATASFPALKRSTTELLVRLADDSTYGGIDAGAYKVGGAAGVDFNGSGAAFTALTTVTFVKGILTAAS